MDSRKRKKLANDLGKVARQDPDAVVELVLDLMERIEKLESGVKKNSSNSSKPPSSDKGNANKPPKASKKDKGQRGRRPGGQRGHKGHTLEQVKTPEHVIEHRLRQCPHTGRALTDKDIVGEIRCQVFDIPEPKMTVTEHVYYVYRAEGCNQSCHRAFLSGASAPVQYGQHFGALLIYLKNFQLIPLKRISQLCLDLYGQKISQATVDRFEKPCFEHLNRFEEHLKIILQRSRILHADETGINIGSVTEWLHCLSNEHYTYLWASDHRGSNAIDEMGVLKDYNGILVHDCYGSYFKLDCHHALCNAHLLRELAFFIDVMSHKWALKMRDLLRSALKAPSKKRYESWLRQYNKILDEAEQEHPFEAPERKQGQRGKIAKPPVNNLIERLRKYKKEVLRFIKDKAVPFTNNQGERDLRMTKVQQKISGCFRTWSGAKRFARIRSYIGTALKQNQSVYHAIFKALTGNPMFIA